jgi:hypothetical protein
MSPMNSNYAKAPVTVGSAQAEGKAVAKSTVGKARRKGKSSKVAKKK